MQSLSRVISNTLLGHRVLRVEYEVDGIAYWVINSRTGSIQRYKVLKQTTN
jgi:hypothetical protein